MTVTTRAANAFGLPIEVGVGWIRGTFVTTQLETVTDPEAAEEVIGVPVAGAVRITARPNALLDAGGTPPVIILPQPLVITLDANGEIYVGVVPTDDPALNPIYWTYHLDFDFRTDDGAPLRYPSFDVAVPTGQTVDLARVAPIPGTGGAVTIVGPRGEQGPQGAQGEQGPPGYGIGILGSFDDPSELPAEGNTPGDAYLIDGDLWVWDGTEWTDAGPVQGPQGPPGVTWPSPVVDAGGQVFNVKAFGATGDGTTDDTAAIQSAINAAGPREVLFPAGTYRFSQLIIPSGCCLSGTGWYSGVNRPFGHSGWLNSANWSGTVLLCNQSTDDAIIVPGNTTNSVIQIRDLLIIGPGTGTTNGINMAYASFVTQAYIKHVQVANFGDSGWRLGYVEDCIFQNPISRGCTNGFTLTSSPAATNQNVYTNVEVQYSSNVGIDVRGGSNLWLGGLIQNCSGTAAIQMSVAGCSANRFTGFHVENSSPPAYIVNHIAGQGNSFDSFVINSPGAATCEIQGTTGNAAFSNWVGGNIRANIDAVNGNWSFENFQSLTLTGNAYVRNVGSANAYLTFPSGKDVIVGGPTALNRGATVGFLHVPTCAGVPIGTPSFTAQAPVIINTSTTPPTLYAYVAGAWTALN